MSYTSPGQHPYQYQAPGQYPQQTYAPQRQEDSVGSWIGISLLMMLPLVNIILLIVMACGGMGSRAKHNWARAQLIMFLIFLVVGGIILGILVAAGVDISEI